MKEMQFGQLNIIQNKSVDEPICTEDTKFFLSNVKVKIQVCCLVLACFFNIAYAELPDINDLTTRERIIIAELSRDISPNSDLEIAKLEALERNDHNGDGTVNLQDFTVFAADYSLFRGVTKMVKPVTDSNAITVYDDGTTKVIRHYEKPLEIFADFNDPIWVDWYLYGIE